MDESRRGLGYRAWVATIFMALVMMLAHGSAEAITLELGQTAPDFTVATLGGGEVSLHDYQGKATVLVFWSSWCSRCREELDYLKKMQVKYPSSSFLAINCDTDRRRQETIAGVRRVVEDLALPFVIGIDDGLETWNLYKISALPTSMIIGPDGKLLFVEAGYTLEFPEAFDKALQSAGASPDARGSLSAAKE